MPDDDAPTDEEFITLDDLYDALEGMCYPVKGDDISRLEYLTQLISDRVKLNINSNTIPESLKSTVIDMICGEFLAGKYATGDLSNFDFDASVKRISEGDTTVEYAYGSGSTTPEQRFKTYVDAMRNPPPYVFSSVRKLRW